MREGGWGTRVGLDATVPIKERERFKRIGVPQEVRDKAKRLIEEWTPPGRSH